MAIKETAKISTQYEKDVSDYLARSVQAYNLPCLDSSLFCGKFNEEICKNIKRNVVVDWLWEKASIGDFKMRISAITIAEVHSMKAVEDGAVKTLRGPLYDSFLKMINDGRKAGFLEVLDVSDRTAKNAHDICCDLDILPNDAIIIANAIEFKSDVVLFWDDKITNKTHSKIRIEEPFIYERDMFNSTIEIATEEEQRLYYEARHPKAAPVEAAESEFRGGNGSDSEGKAVGKPADSNPDEKRLKKEEREMEMKRPEV